MIKRAVPLFPDEERTEAYHEVMKKLHYITINAFSTDTDGYVHNTYQKEVFMLKYLLDTMYNKINPEWKKEWEQKLLAHKLSEE